MKKILLLLFISAGFSAKTQPLFPPYKEVLERFYGAYSPVATTDGIGFARKRDGWHVTVTDLLTQNLRSEQAFWSVKTGEYQRLTGFDAPQQTKKTEDLVRPFLNGSANSYNFYGYERCRYYGYSRWDRDMVNDFGSLSLASLPDTLLEGLGRAYANYVNGFCWYQTGGEETAADSLRRKLRPLELPSAQRTDSIVFYIHKATACFTELKKRNLFYKTLVGNSGMKEFNEQMHGYNQMIMSGDEKKAAGFLAEIKPNETLEKMAKNYLGNCPLNSILITFGDNDTYPLWYVQETQHYRQDVAVINESLLGVPAYIHMLHRKGIAAFSTPPAVYGSEAYQYSLYRSEKNFPGKQLSLAQLLTLLQTKKYKDESSYYSEPKAAYPTRNVVLKVDPLRFKKISAQAGLGTAIRFTLSDYLTLDRMLVYDLIQTNLYKRPVCFTAAADYVSAHLQTLGSVYQLLPLNPQTPAANENADNRNLENYLQTTFQFVSASDHSTGIAPDAAYEKTAHYFFARVAIWEFTGGNKAKAAAWMKKLTGLCSGKFEPGNDGYLGYAYAVAGDTVTATVLIEQSAQFAYDSFVHPSALAPVQTKTSALNDVLQLSTTLDQLKLHSAKVDALKELLMKD